MSPSLEIPTLRTERLVLRGFRLSDLDAFAAISADAEVMRYIGPGDTLDRNASWRSMAGLNGHWSLHGVGMWAIERQQDGALIGRAGLIHPPFWPELELGWLLARDAWGHGYAREAAGAALAWTRREVVPERLVSYIRPGNERSVKVALALGARLEGDGVLMGLPVQVFVHARRRQA